MAGSRHPILADTSALIALAAADQWSAARGALRVTTTNVCRNELRRHVRDGREYAPEGSREHRLYHGSERALAAFEDDDAAFSVVTVVGVDGGEDAGERSLETELRTNGDAYRYVAIHDAGGRDRLRRLREREDCNFRVVPPTFLLYVCFDNDVLGKPEFCRACAAMIEGEGWTTASSVYAMWDAIPVDCSAYVDDRLLPD